MQVWGWRESLPDHHRQWHPDHLTARWVAGRGFRPGGGELAVARHQAGEGLNLRAMQGRRDR